LRHEAKVDGALGLNGAYAGTIVDERNSWPKHGDLLLNTVAAQHPRLSAFPGMGPVPGAETEERSLPSLHQRRPGLAGSGQTQIDCFLKQPEAQSFPKFNASIYSLEAVIPGLETGQRNDWSPDTRFDLGFASKLFEYLQRIAGLVLGLLAFAGFSGLVKSQ
jgi:hypothetical protein